MVQWARMQKRKAQLFFHFKCIKTVVLDSSISIWRPPLISTTWWYLYCNVQVFISIFFYVFESELKSVRLKKLSLARPACCFWHSPRHPHWKLKRLPLAGTHLLMTSGSTVEKPQEQSRPGRFCGAALTRCCGGDKTSDSLIDGLTDITIPCESTEWPMPGPHF